MATKYLAKLKKSENRYYVSARFDKEGQMYSGISEVVIVKGRILPARNRNRFYWHHSLDEKILKLVESFLHEPVKSDSQAENAQGSQSQDNSITPEDKGNSEVIQGQDD